MFTEQALSEEDQTAARSLDDKGQHHATKQSVRKLCNFEAMLNAGEAVSEVVQVLQVTVQDVLGSVQEAVQLLAKSHVAAR